jgi:hypothetical protein
MKLAQVSFPEKSPHITKEMARLLRDAFFLGRRDIIRLSTHSRCPFQYPALKTGRFGRPEVPFPLP